MASIPALVLSYKPMPLRPISAWADETLTMLPRPLARKCGKAQRLMVAVPTKFTPTIACHSAGVASAKAE